MNPRIHAFNSRQCRLQGIKHCFLDFGPGLEGGVALGHECSITNHNSEIWSDNKEVISFQLEGSNLNFFPSMLYFLFSDGDESGSILQNLGEREEKTMKFAVVGN